MQQPGQPSYAPPPQQVQPPAGYQQPGVYVPPPSAVPEEPKRGRGKQRPPKQKKSRKGKAATTPPQPPPGDRGFTVEGGSVVPTGAATKRRKGNPLAGGRWVQFAVKALIVVVLAVIALNGVYRLAGKALYDPPTAAPGSNFPTQQASAYAARFAWAYLSWDQAKPQDRATALQPFFPANNNLQLGWDGKGVQQVLGQPIPAGVNAADDQHAVVQLAVFLSPGGWTCMQVGVYSPNKGQTMAITSYTAYVACPPTAAVTVPDMSNEDSAVETQLSPVLDSFFRAYGASSPDLQLTLATGSTINGLGGSVKLSSVDRVIVPALAAGGDPNRRVATVNVSWVTASGGVLAQSYQVTMVKADKWTVLSLAGGAASADIAPQQGGAVQPSPSGSGAPGAGPSTSPSGTPSATPS